MVTGTAFDFIRVPVHCAQCGKESPLPLRELVALDTIVCPFCGKDVDLKARQAEFLKLADEYKQIKKLRGS